jgi:hypothetical protein
MAKLIEISTQRIDRFSSLPHELLTHPKSDSQRHSSASSETLHIMRCDQSDLMAVI